MSGWNKAAWSERPRETGYIDDSRPEAHASGWSTFEIAALVIAFAARWELGLVFLGLKLWQQASRYPGNAFTFARHKWERLVDTARNLAAGSSLFSHPLGGRPFGPVGARPYEGEDFDAWRTVELARLDFELDRVKRSEALIANYRDTLVRARDRAEFDRMRVVRP